MPTHTSHPLLARAKQFINKVAVKTGLVRPIGFLDGVQSVEIVGWALPTTSSESTATVHVKIDGETVATIIADYYRSDLQAARYGKGMHAFRAIIPRRFLDGQNHIIEAFRSDGRPLRDSPKEIFLGAFENPDADSASEDLESPRPPATLQDLEKDELNVGFEDILEAVKGNDGRIVIVYPIIPWELRHQRPQHLSAQFRNRGYTVIYIAQTLAPQGHKVEDMRALKEAVSVQKIEENIYYAWLPCVHPVNIYVDRLADANLNMVADGLSILLHACNPLYSIHLVQFPGWRPLAREMENRFGGHVIYDCMDHHGGFSTNKSAALDSEPSLIESADLVLASSLFLEKELSKNAQEVLLVKNATEFVHFANCQPNGELDHLSDKPIIGYFGAISDWFDIDLIQACAERGPDWNFVLIGSTEGCDVTAIQSLPNVFLLGEKPYSELPGYLAYFDVCTIPFKITPLTEATNPVKFYEYMSAGKPVVSTALPELTPYKEFVTIGETPDQFFDGLQQALGAVDDKDAAEQRCAMATKNTWDDRGKTLFASPIFTKVFDRPEQVRASIILVTYNGLDQTTRSCVESVLAKTPAGQYELIIIDNQSREDDTRDYLRNLERSYEHIFVKLNPTNKGFAGGNNDGIRMSRGKFVILLNNDTLVPENWLDALLRPFEANKNIGIVGPVTNSSGNEQCLDLPGLTEGNFEEIAAAYTSRHSDHQYFSTRLGFFCVAIKRSVIDQVGLLDERFGVGMFEDDDYCVRSTSAGYRCVVTEGCFVYHKGSVSFKKLAANKFKELFERNRGYFEQKHDIAWSLTDIANSFLNMIESNLADSEGNMARRELAVERIQRRLPTYRHLQQQIRITELRGRSAPNNTVDIRGASIADLVYENNDPATLAKSMGELRRQYLSGKVVVMTATVDFGFMRQRPQQIALAFAKSGYTVFYCTLSRQTDRVEIWEPSGAENIVLLNENILPMLHHAVVPEETIFYCMWPISIDKAKWVPHSFMIYDYMDDLSILGGAQETIERLHDEALQRADLITVSAEKLAETIPKAFQNKMLMVPNAVDQDFIVSARMERPVAEELSVISDTCAVVGYVGAIASWLDFDLLSAVAKQMPEVHFVFLGPIIDASDLVGEIASLPNVSIFPPVPHERVLDFLAGMDVCTIPFRINHVTQSVSPVKLYEYMAAGKPVVSTALHECLDTKGVAIAHNIEEYIAHLREALLKSKDPETAKVLGEYAQQNSWSERIKRIIDKLPHHARQTTEE